MPGSPSRRRRKADPLGGKPVDGLDKSPTSRPQENKSRRSGHLISPLLSNVYLHYVFDLWAERWRRREAAGDMIMVRYADDIIVGFQHESDARRFWNAMRDRLAEFYGAPLDGGEKVGRASGTLKVKSDVSGFCPGGALDYYRATFSQTKICRWRNVDGRKNGRTRNGGDPECLPRGCG
jgi:hypothetical protein